MAAKITKKLNSIKAVTLKILDHKGLEVRAVNVAKHCSYADYFLFVTATSSTHAQAIANALAASFPVPSNKIEGYQKGEWIIIDLGDILVHVFQKSFRQFYNLDKLWSHAPDVSFAKMGIASEPTQMVSAF
ncbi:MAG: ribosome silencing factor [Bdellovibrionota bacterium]